MSKYCTRRKIIIWLWNQWARFFSEWILAFSIDFSFEFESFQSPDSDSLDEAAVFISGTPDADMFSSNTTLILPAKFIHKIENQADDDIQDLEPWCQQKAYLDSEFEEHNCTLWQEEIVKSKKWSRANKIVKSEQGIWMKMSKKTNTILCILNKLDYKNQRWMVSLNTS